MLKDKLQDLKISLSTLKKPALKLNLFFLLDPLKNNLINRQKNKNQITTFLNTSKLKVMYLFHFERILVST